VKRSDFSLSASGLEKRRLSERLELSFFLPGKRGINRPKVASLLLARLCHVVAITLSYTPPWRSSDFAYLRALTYGAAARFSPELFPAGRAPQTPLRDSV